VVDSYDRFKREFSTATGRWAALGPYYAMFPLGFAFEVVSKHSQPGQLVLDPFAGRATSIYAAAVQGRQALGIEITAVGWLFGQAKLRPAPLADVLVRLDDLKNLTENYRRHVSNMPEFYRYCFSPNVLAFLLAARSTLDWQSTPADTVLMALITAYLHGKLGAGLSNQMRMTKAMAPDYSIRWWKDHNCEKPPEVDWYSFLQTRIKWRYAKGVPPTQFGELRMGDSTVCIKEIFQATQDGSLPRCSLLFTSPPYWGVINYYKDQWLRNWMLGGTELPTVSLKRHEGRFESQAEYRDLLITVFGTAATIMADNAVVYVRTDAREFTLNTTSKVLQDVFPGWSMRTMPIPITGKTQTSLFGDKSEKPGEVDLILSSTNTRT